MATLATQTIRRQGTAPAYAAAAAGGDRFTPGNTTFLHVKNGGGGTITVTIDVPLELIRDVAIGGRNVGVSAGSEKIIGPFAAEYFASGDGLADITYTGVTSVTIGAFDLDQQ